MHKKTKGNLLITLGILLIAAAIGLAGYNLWDAGRAQKAAEEITGQLITNVDGLTIRYIVTNRETVEPTAVEQMIENTSNSETSLLDWDLTLFTCNLGGQTRCAVRCSRAADGSTGASDAK